MQICLQQLCWALLASDICNCSFRLFRRHALLRTLLWSCLVDISGAIVNLVLAQSWLSFFNLVITIAANSFYTFLGTFAVASDLNFTIVGFVVLLPLVLSVFHSLQRRNQALYDLSLGKLHAFDTLIAAFDTPQQL